jgi:hypothetical protein
LVKGSVETSRVMVVPKHIFRHSVDVKDRMIVLEPNVVAQNSQL